MTSPSLMPQGLALVFFSLAVFHTFACPAIINISHKWPSTSWKNKILHLLGEVELVFALWAITLIVSSIGLVGSHTTWSYVGSLSFAEPLFVGAVVCLAASRPIISLASSLVLSFAKYLPIPYTIGVFSTILVFVPLLGSFISEPAAMAVAAQLLWRLFFQDNKTTFFRYGLIGLLFVNISIGGTLTHFAAPPILMVAKPWGWDTPFVFQQFGLKSTLAVICNTLVFLAVFWKDILRTPLHKTEKRPPSSLHHHVPQDDGLPTLPPVWVVLGQVIFVVGAVILHAKPMYLFGWMALFGGFYVLSKKHQSALKIKESILVALFLSGLVVLGGLQGWWLTPIVSSLGPTQLFLSAMGLTAITDNAALTYLGTLIPNFADHLKYSLVSGAVAGGGLTLIANAPNLAGYEVLRNGFHNRSVTFYGLFLGALPFTFVAAAFYLMLK